MNGSKAFFKGEVKYLFLKGKSAQLSIKHLCFWIFPVLVYTLQYGKV